ncbi:hypothetical protein [Streptomyces sp. NPDC058964]|uniref:hypothetical protein n=1 Tax=Streptomyces sp. NPDC058964 TaxID=3346681 RepID=UPI00367DA8BE
MPVSSLSRLTSQALSAAASVGHEVRAVTVFHPDPEDRAQPHALERACVREAAASEPATRVTVLIPETEPERLWQRLLQKPAGCRRRPHGAAGDRRGHLPAAVPPVPRRRSRTT